jgi:predicted nucleotidyltransferase component of viral defense system
MTRKGPQNHAASIRQRLLNKARQQNEDFNLVLFRYAAERLLYRLSRSSHRDRFVLKGATLFQIWTGQSHRPTRDLDLLGQGMPSSDKFLQLFREVCQQDVEEDGLEFRSETVRAEPIKEDDEYQGLRLKLQATLAPARIQLQIDIGFGDAVTPAPDEIDFPTLLDLPAPSLKAYPRETVVAEKYQAMVMLGIANSRMKDFYDVWTLARQFAFSGITLSKAIRATFERRQTAIPEQLPMALDDEFAQDRQKLTQWKAFIGKNKLNAEDSGLPEIVETLRNFLMPPTGALLRATDFDQDWQPLGPWRPCRKG